MLVDTFGTGIVSDEKLTKAVLATFDARPGMLIQELDLRRPIFRKTAAYGHFGREEPEFTWEKTPLVDELQGPREVGQRPRATNGKAAAKKPASQDCLGAARRNASPYRARCRKIGIVASCAVRDRHVARAWPRRPSPSRARAVTLVTAGRLGAARTRARARSRRSARGTRAGIATPACRSRCGARTSTRRARVARSAESPNARRGQFVAAAPRRARARRYRVGPTSSLVADRRRRTARAHRQSASFAQTLARRARGRRRSVGVGVSARRSPSYASRSRGPRAIARTRTVARGRRARRAADRPRAGDRVSHRRHRRRRRRASAGTSTSRPTARRARAAQHADCDATGTLEYNAGVRYASGPRERRAAPCRARSR